MSPRIASPSRAVSRRAASSGEAAARATQSATGTGSPIETTAQPVRNVPGSWNMSPTGSRVTGPTASASAASSIRAAPVRSGISSGSGWLTPSGKIRIAWPFRKVADEASKSAVLRAGSVPPSWRRCTGSAPMRRRKGPIRGFEKSGALATETRRRGKWPSSSTPSTSALWWLAATMSGPVGGMRSTPITSTRR